MGRGLARGTLPVTGLVKLIAEADLDGITVAILDTEGLAPKVASPGCTLDTEVCLPASCV